MIGRGGSAKHTTQNTIVNKPTCDIMGGEGPRENERTHTHAHAHVHTYIHKHKQYARASSMSVSLSHILLERSLLPERKGFR